MKRIAWSAHWLSLRNRFPDAIALSNGQGDSLSFQALCSHVLQVAGYFQAKGFGHGERVASWQGLTALFQHQPSQSGFNLSVGRLSRLSICWVKTCLNISKLSMARYGPD